MILLRSFAVISFLSAGFAFAYWWRRQLLHHRALARVSPGSDAGVVASRADTKSTLRRPLRYVPLAIGVLLGGIAFFLLGWPWHFAGALGAVSCLIANQLEAFLAVRKTVRLETQLADCIDIMVGAVGAGSGVNQALEAAIRETKAPLKPELEEVVGRIRLGDRPGDVFEAMATRIPLEPFLLFASTLAVHWEVGGELAPTLATISRTVRDRIETNRRVRSNISQSQMSTIAILGLTYMIAVVIWRNNPVQMREFLATEIGGFFVAASIVMQAVGVMWMNAISKVRF